MWLDKHLLDFAALLVRSKTMEVDGQEDCFTSVALLSSDTGAKVVASSQLHDVPCNHTQTEDLSATGVDRHMPPVDDEEHCHQGDGDQHQPSCEGHVDDEEDENDDKDTHKATSPSSFKPKRRKMRKRKRSSRKSTTRKAQPGDGSSGLEAGPASLSEAVEYHAMYLRDVANHNPRWRKLVAERFKKGVVITTSYSGAGCAEAVCPLLDGGLQCFSATEVEREKRQLLMEHRAASRPAHVFGEVLEVCTLFGNCP